MKTLNVAIIGYGKMGKIRAESINRHKHARISAVFDTQAKCSSYNSPTSIDEIMADRHVNAVFICVPNHLNKSLTIEALKAGKHVFCEKPPAFNSDEVAEIMRVEQATGCKLMYGLNHRHHSAVKHIKKSIDSGHYGRLLWMRGRYGKSVDHNFFNTWRAKKELAGGGILLDQGIHMLDLLLYLGGNFDQTHAFVSSLYWKTEGIEDNVFAIMRNSISGTVASLHSTMTQWRHLFSLEVFLEGGYMVLNGLKTPSNTYGEEVLSIAKNRTQAPAATWDDEERLHFETDTSWDEEVGEFFSAILEDRPVGIGTSRDAFETMVAIDRIYKNEHMVSDALYSTLWGSKVPQ